ncbi:MAG TPA: ABC transporter permease [Thermoproteota archaeon]|nr:ABC transporter permease [Thermoproteota archaeon]
MGLERELSHMLWITWKDLMELWRSRMRLAMMILMPLIMMTMMSFIFPSSQNILSNIPIAVVDNDLGAQGAAFLSTLSNMNAAKGLISFKSASSVQEARDMILRGEALGAIIIPENFSDALTTHLYSANITVLTDDSNPQISQVLSQVLTQVIDGMSLAQATMNVYPYAMQVHVNPIAIVVPYSAQTEGVVSGGGSYIEFMIPGLLMMNVITSMMTGLPRAIAYEKDTGTLAGFLASPISRVSIIAGKALGHIIRGLIQAAVSLALAIVLFGITIHGDIMLVVLVLFLGVYSFVGLGITLTSVAEDEETAAMIMMTLTMPMIFLSGVFFPVQMMPDFMQTISHWLPFTYAIDAMRRIMIFGVTLSNVVTDIAVLLAFGTVMLIVAIPAFEKAMTR